ncbi:MAG: LAGLIDADG family homing endonuclease [Candidatus Aenigmatarchaeota archaeon]
MVYETIVGRLKEDREKFGNKCAGYLGKHIVGTGEDAHLTTKVFIDLLRPHILLISGKRGTGKSYVAGIIAEEIALLPEEFRKNLAVVMIDTMGIFWSLKKPNEQQKSLLREWGLEPRGFENVRIFAPYSQLEEFKNVGIPVDEGISILPYEFSAEEWCLLPDVKIITNSDIKPINKLREGEKVLTHRGDYKTIYRTFKRAYKGEMVEITPMLLNEPIALTPNHPVLALKSNKKILEWVEAGKLEKDDKVVFPRIKKIKDKKILVMSSMLDGIVENGYFYSIGSNQYRSGFKHGSSNPIPNQIKIDKNLMRVFGYYIAEGSTRDKNRQLVFSFNTNEKSYIDDVCSIMKSKFNLKAHIEKGKRNTMYLCFMSKPLACLFIKLLGKKAKNKKLPAWALYLPEGKLIEIIKGLWRGDGSLQKYKRRNKEYYYFSYFTTSELLTHQLKLSLLKLGFIPSIHYNKKRGEYQVRISGKQVIEFGKRIGFPLPKLKIKSHNFGWVDENYVYLPIRKIKRFKYDGFVYNLGVERDNSYATSSFVVHNCMAFNLKRTEPAGVALEKIINQLLESKQKFSIDDIIIKIRDDKETSQEVKSALENMLTVANQWGVFGEKGINIDDIIQPGQISVVDVSRLRATEAWSVRNFIVAIIARKIYEYRLLARKEEEIAKLERRELEKRYPMVWLIVDEAHNFCPSDFETVSSQPFLTIAKQGREPGVSLVVITQMPNKIHQDILSQCDLVISHRLTSRDDLQALHAVYQTYMAEEIEKMINRLPRWPGAALILDDNLEKIFTINARPRYSWHAGGTAIVV